MQAAMDVKAWPPLHKPVFTLPSAPSMPATARRGGRSSATSPPARAPAVSNLSPRKLNRVGSSLDAAAGSPNVVRRFLTGNSSVANPGSLSAVVNSAADIPAGAVLAKVLSSELHPLSSRGPTGNAPAPVGSRLSWAPRKASGQHAQSQATPASASWQHVGKQPLSPQRPVQRRMSTSALGMRSERSSARSSSPLSRHSAAVIQTTAPPVHDLLVGARESPKDIGRPVPVLRGIARNYSAGLPTAGEHNLGGVLRQLTREEMIMSGRLRQTTNTLSSHCRSVSPPASRPAIIVETIYSRQLREAQLCQADECSSPATTELPMTEIPTLLNEAEQADAFTGSVSSVVTQPGLNEESFEDRSRDPGFTGGCQLHRLNSPAIAQKLGVAVAELSMRPGTPDALPLEASGRTAPPVAVPFLESSTRTVIPVA